MKGVVSDDKPCDQALMAQELQEAIPYRVLVEGSIQGMCLQQDDIIQFANTAMAHMFGYNSPEALIGRPVWDFIAPHEHARLYGYREARLRGEPAPARYEYQGLHQDGSLLWIDHMGSVATWRQRPAIFSTFHDITGKKRAEMQLRASEARFSAIFHLSPYAIVLTRLSDRICVAVSDRFSEVMGYATSEILGKTPAAMNIWVNPVERDRLWQLVATEGEVQNMEATFRTRNGTVLAALLSATILELDGESHLLTIAQDISALKHAETARAAEAHFVQVQNDIAQVALSSLDPALLLPRLLEVICTTQGYTYGGFWRLTADAQAAVVLAAYGEGTASLVGFRQDMHAPDSFMVQTLRSGQAAFCNRLQESPFGMHPVSRILNVQAILGVPLVDRAGQAIGLLVFCETTDPERFSAHDVQQGMILARQMAQALENAELFSQVQRLQEQYRVVTEALHDPIYMVDREGRLLFANTALARLTGYSLEELLHAPSTMFFSPEVVPLAVERRQRVYSGLEVAPYFRMPLVRKDGQRLEVELSMGSLVVAGKAVGRVVVVRDLTDRLRLEAQLRQQQKLQAIGTLAGGIAHDFNNILMAIMGYTELTLDDVPRDSRADSHLRCVLSAAERAKGLVQQMLAFSRQQEPVRQAVQVRSLIEEALQLLRAALPSTIAIHLNLEAPTGAVLVDPTQIHQVLMNLCINAAHAMHHSGGVLAISLDECVLATHSPAVSPDLAPGRYMRLTVRDTGHGMPPKVLEHIFEPFFTTKNVGEGTGLGLAVVHGIVMSHGGSITVDSTPGQGTTFTLYLPQHQQAPPGAPRAQARVPQGTERILFVDDEEALTRLGTVALTRAGYVVTACSSSLAALAAFRGAPAAFDLLITDYTMPDMTGATLSAEVRRIRPDMPIILGTGFHHNMSPEQAQSLDIDAFYPKPYTMSELAALVRHVLTQRQTAQTCMTGGAVQPSTPPERSLQQRQ